MDKGPGNNSELGNSNSEANLSHSGKRDEGQGAETEGGIGKPSRTEGVCEDLAATSG